MTDTFDVPIEWPEHVLDEDITEDEALQVISNGNDLPASIGLVVRELNGVRLVFKLRRSPARVVLVDGYRIGAE